MSALHPILTKCAREGCDQMTAGTFCSRECNRVAHSGPGTRTPKLQTGSTGPGTRHASAGTHESHDWLLTIEEQERLADYDRERFGVQTLRSDRRLAGNSNAKRLANIRKRRQEREALMAKRQAMRRRKCR